ncbi:MAG: hypothetical protein RL722_1771 [Pseudomonadota bacterium]|jgi:hypothetical protein
MHVQPDHPVVVCASLEQGRAWCEATLGATPQAGGQHAHMGTHNLLLNLSAPGQDKVYLELIAIDPQAPAPTRPRWFNMDEAALQAKVAEAPQLVAWVARSPQIDMHRWGMITVGVHPGTTVAASRQRADGSELRWQIVLRDDGKRQLDGAVPVLIQWSGEHPCDRLPASGVGLVDLSARGLPPRVVEVMRLRGVQRPADEGPALSVRLSTPLGERELVSPRW